MVKPYKVSDIWLVLQRHLGITFVYESTHKSITSHQNSQTTSQESSLDEEIAALPRGWMVELDQAARQLKGKQVEHLIEQIRPSHGKIASLLSHYSQAYQFDRICHWISATDKKVGKL